MAAGNAAAYGARSQAKVRVRKRANDLLKRIAYKGRKDGRPDYIEFAPGSSDPSVVADLSARVNWYLKGRQVPVFMDGAAGIAFGPEDAPWMDPNLVFDPGWEAERPPGRGELVVHDVTIGSVIRFVRGMGAATLATPWFFDQSEWDWAALTSRYCEASLPTEPESIERILERARPRSSVLVLATGPSASELDPATVTEPIRITCNSAVRNHDLIAALKPDVIAFSDPVFHCGPSRYAAEFRKDLRHAFETTDALFATGNHWSAPVFAHMPELRERSVVLAHGGSDSFSWVTPDSASVRSTGNVLTNLLLPIGFALGDDLAIAGCDGRNPSESYFWKHNPSTQYSDEMMQTAFAAHPAFFRDRDYVDYYDAHCAELEEFLSLAEAAGKSVRSVTSSHIPALVARSTKVP